MSAPRRKRTKAPKRPGLTRRSFLKGLGLGSATLGSLGTLSACGGSSNSGPTSTTTQGAGNGQTVSFLHAVASGDPTANSVIMWTRVTPSDTSSAVSGRLDVYLDEALTSFVKSIAFITDSTRDFTVKIDCDGLKPDTFYYYRFLSNGVQSPVARTKTTPDAGSKREVKLGLVSCSSMAHGFFNAYDLLADKEDLDAIVHLGDYIYEYGSGQYGSLREYEPATEITTLSDYRTRHAQYKRDEDLQKLHLRYPFITIWDDHESTDNSYRDGANNHTEGEEGVWEERKSFAQKAYDEWMPIRLPEFGNPGKIFRKISFGGMADLILLDTRLYDRDEPAAGLEGSLVINPLTDNVSDADRTLIGQEQFDFLVNNLRESQAQWKLIGNQVVFHQWIIKPGLNNPAPTPVQDIIAPSGLNGDSWDAYSAERQRIINTIRGSDGGKKVDNVVILTGDVHSEWVADITDNPNQPISQAGGYNPITGEGSVATEFVVSSVTSPGLPLPDEFVQLIRVSSPHIKHVKMSDRGYCLLKLTQEKAVCEYYAVSTIEQRGATETLTNSFEVLTGTNRIAPSTPSVPL